MHGHACRRGISFLYDHNHPLIIDKSFKATVAKPTLFTVHDKLRWHSYFGRRNVFLFPFKNKMKSNFTVFDVLKITRSFF